MKIDQTLLEKSLGINARVFNEIDSTNLYVKRCILQNESVPDLVVSHGQTNGLGRTGKSFYSPALTGVYATFAVKESDIHCDDITARVALATARAIDSVFACCCGLKWVNDVYLDNKKVSGILCQKVGDYVLIGIGINVEEPETIPDDLLGKFGAVTKICPASKYNDLIIALHRHILFSLSEENNSILSEYRARCVHVNKTVCIVNNGAEINGNCIGIDEDFSLLLSIDGKIHRFTSGYMTLHI